MDSTKLNCYLTGSSPVHLDFENDLIQTTPYVMFEIKKTQILTEFLYGTKKVQLVGKKISPWVQRISHHFFAVDHPLCDV